MRKCEVSCQMYAEVIEQFLFEEFPGVEVREDIRFEALSRAVFGSKQLRNGPLPKPEQQVEIRNILRRNKEIHFFIAWGCKKQQEGIGFDILDFIALKQLYSLRENIQRCGWNATFNFRLEDLTDRMLFGSYFWSEIMDYRKKFTHFASDLGPVQWESTLMDWEHFREKVNQNRLIIHGYFEGRLPTSDLHSLGWKGDIPTNQRNYYLEMYKTFYPNVDPMSMLSTYFAIALARTQLNGKGWPDLDFIQISFTNPVPGDPIVRKRVNYRSVPERYTHIHRAPWLAKGYLKITDDGTETTVTPKISLYGEMLPLHKNFITIEGHSIECDYLVD